MSLLAVPMDFQCSGLGAALEEPHQLGVSSDAGACPKSCFDFQVFSSEVEAQPRSLGRI